MISITVSRIFKSRGEGILFTLMIEKTYDSAFSMMSSDDSAVSVPSVAL